MSDLLCTLSQFFVERASHRLVVNGMPVLVIRLAGIALHDDFVSDMTGTPDRLGYGDSVHGVRRKSGFVKRISGSIMRSFSARSSSTFSGP